MTMTSPWLTVSEAAKHARCGDKLIYKEVRAGRLKASRMGAAVVSCASWRNGSMRGYSRERGFSEQADSH
jgi:excisionase family DNA binding protein